MLCGAFLLFIICGSFVISSFLFSSPSHINPVKKLWLLIYRSYQAEIREVKKWDY